MAKTNTGLVAYAKAQLGRPYWYGCFGQTSTPALYTSKKKQYPQQYQWPCSNNQSGTSPAKQLGVKVHDCVGLIKGYLWCSSAEGAPTYKASQDVSANGMLSVCKKKGKIGTMPDVPGVLVFLPGHVGVYIGGGYVIEAKGHRYGVVKTALKGRGWTDWGYCPWITYEEKKATTTTPAKPATTTVPKRSIDEVAKSVINGDYGVGEDRVKRLTAAGYDAKAVQKRVNEMLAGKTTTTKKTVAQIAKEVIEGKWGNGEERKKKLKAAGYDYNAVQKEVNKQLKK